MATTIALHEETRARLARIQEAARLPSMDAVVTALLDAPQNMASILWAHHRDAAESTCRDRGIRRVVAFGSRAWGTPHATSDLDLMVEFERTPDLWTLQDVEEELARAVGVRVDLHTPGSLRARLRERVESEGVRLLG